MVTILEFGVMSIQNGGLQYPASQAEWTRETCWDESVQTIVRVGDKGVFKTIRLTPSPPTPPPPLAVVAAWPSPRKDAYLKKGCLTIPAANRLCLHRDKVV
jgi:hypothetical protein